MWTLLAQINIPKKGFSIPISGNEDGGLFVTAKDIDQLKWLIITAIGTAMAYLLKELIQYLIRKFQRIEEKEEKEQEKKEEEEQRYRAGLSHTLEKIEDRLERMDRQLSSLQENQMSSDDIQSMVKKEIEFVERIRRR